MYAHAHSEHANSEYVNYIRKGDLKSFIKEQIEYWENEEKTSDHVHEAYCFGRLIALEQIKEVFDL